MAKQTTKKTAGPKKTNKILTEKEKMYEAHNHKFRKAKFNLNIILDIRNDAEMVDLRKDVFDTLAKVIANNVPNGSIKLVDVKQMSSMFL